MHTLNHECAQEAQHSVLCRGLHGQGITQERHSLQHKSTWQAAKMPLPGYAVIQAGFKPEIEDGNMMCPAQVAGQLPLEACHALGTRFRSDVSGSVEWPS